MLRAVLELRKNSSDASNAKNNSNVAPESAHNDISSSQKLMTPNMSSLDSSMEQHRNNSISPLRKPRDKKRSSTVFPLDNISENLDVVSLAQPNKQEKRSPNRSPKAEEHPAAPKKIIEKNDYKKSSTTKQENKNVARAKTIRQPAQPKFNPDQYEEVYGVNKIIRKVERANQKRRTMMGLPPRNNLPLKRSSSSSSSTSSASGSPKSDSEPHTPIPLTREPLIPSNRSSANRKEELNHSGHSNQRKISWNLSEDQSNQVRKVSFNLNEDPGPNQARKVSFNISEDPGPNQARKVSFSISEDPVPNRVSFGLPNRISYGNELHIPNRDSYSSRREGPRRPSFSEVNEEQNEEEVHHDHHHNHHHHEDKEEKESNLKPKIRKDSKMFESNGYAEKEENDDDENYSRYLGVQRMTTKEKRHWRLRKDPEYKHLKWIFFPDDPIRMYWDLTIIAILMYTTCVLPLRVAEYIDDSGVGWLISDWFLNVFFLFDIIVNFFSAYLDQDLNLVTSRKKIIHNYLFGWLFIDICAIIPFDLILGSGNSYQQLLRVSRITRLYKLIKLFKNKRVTRILKLFKEKTVIMKYIQKLLHLSPQVERLLVSFLMILLFVHLSACGWKFLLEFYADQPNNWLVHCGFYDQFGNPIASQVEIYIASAYLVVQTITTVGYGDLTANTEDERIACTFWIFIGVFVYSFVIGSLSSLISSLDTKEVQFSQKLNTLIQLKQEYKFDNALYLKIKNALRYGTKQHEDNNYFLKGLPHQLRQDLSCIIYKEILDAIPFFAGKPKSFIATIAPLLRPIEVHKGEAVYHQGDPADEMFFLKSGEVAYVIPKYFDFKFLKIKEGYYFGETDLLFYGEIRKYTLKAVKTSELYVLNKKDFKHIFLMEFRDIGLEIVSGALSRKLRTRKAYKETMTVLSKTSEPEFKEDAKKLKLQHKMTVWQEDHVNDIEEEDFNNTDSEEEAEKRRNTQLFPGLNLIQEAPNSLEKIDEAEDETTTPMATLTKSQARKLSKFFEPTSFSGLVTTTQEPSPLIGRAAKSDSLKKEPEVKDIHQKVDQIQDKLNNLLSMSIKLEEGLLGNYTGDNQRNDKKAMTFKASPQLESGLKTRVKRNSVSYSSHNDLLENMTRSRAGATQGPSSFSTQPKPTLARKNSARSTWKRGSRKDSQIMDISAEVKEEKEVNNEPRRSQKLSTLQIKVTKAGDDGWETISENEKKIEEVSDA